jgi:signal transduction histidine kinase
MKDGFRKAVDIALWFLGAKTRRTLARPGKEGKTAPAGSASRSREAVVSTSGIWYLGPEARPDSETSRYEQVAELLDTRVLADRGWLKCLRGAEVWQTISKLDPADLNLADRASLQLSSRLFDLVSHFSAEYNDLARQLISMTPLSDVSEKRKVNRSMSSMETTEFVVYNRWRASTAAWALSCRTKNGVIEIFLLPAPDLMALSQAEVPLRLRLRLELLKVGDRLVWTCGGLPISAEDLRVLMRMFFRDLVSSTQEQEQPVQSTASLGGSDDARLARSIEQLLIEREGLAQKVVIQQEEIQKRIARDLHDAVISDVMALKRNISSAKPVAAEDTLAALEVIVRKLREICYDLSPRDLSDWGLATVVDDMLDQIAQRTGIDCVLNCDIEIPVMPAAVLLHVYRIIQESLNNAEKYAEPSRVVVTLGLRGSIFVITIQDNGKGFETDAGPEKSGRAGGYGMGSLKERADLIRCFYPTRFSLNSAPGKGTLVRLEINLSHSS